MLLCVAQREGWECGSWDGGSDKTRRDAASAAQVDSEKPFAAHALVAAMRSVVFSCNHVLITDLPCNSSRTPWPKFPIISDEDPYSHECLRSYPAASCIFDFSALIRARPDQYIPA